jgi:hypothetical protein
VNKNKVPIQADSEFAIITASQLDYNQNQKRKPDATGMALMKRFACIDNTIFNPDTISYTDSR